MPLYEYRCAQCGRLTEKIQKFSDPELTVCPHCSGALERTLTAPAVHFSGGGWYKDLYSSTKPAAPGGESQGGGDSKPAGEGGSPAPANATNATNSGNSANSGSSGAPGSSGSGATPASSAPSTPAAAPAPSKG